MPAHDPSPRSTEGLLPALRRFAETRDDAALDPLVAALGAEVLPFIRRRLTPRLARRVDPLDIFQEVCLRLHGMRDRFRDQGDRAAWALIYTIARREVMRVNTHHRAQRRDVHMEESRLAARSASSSGRAAADESPGSVTTPSGAAQRREHADIVRDCLGILSKTDRELIHLLDYEQLGSAAVSERLGVSREALRVRHHRALQRLRELVEQQLSGPG